MRVSLNDRDRLLMLAPKREQDANRTHRLLREGF